jgi:hypothetical protein
MYRRFSTAQPKWLSASRYSPKRYLNEATPGLPVIKLWRVSCRLGLPGFKGPTGEIPTPLSDHIPLGGVVRCGRRCWRPLSFPSRRLRSNFVNRIAEIFQHLGRLPCPIAVACSAVTSRSPSFTSSLSAMTEIVPKSGGLNLPLCSQMHFQGFWRALADRHERPQREAGKAPCRCR